MAFAAGLGPVVHAAESSSRPVGTGSIAPPVVSTYPAAIEPASAAASSSSAPVGAAPRSDATSTPIGVPTSAANLPVPLAQSTTAETSSLAELWGTLVKAIMAIVGMLLLGGLAIISRPVREWAVETFKRATGGIKRQQITIVCAGLGGVGKSTLVRQIIQDPTASNHETAASKVYRTTRTIPSDCALKPDCEVELWLIDYPGQNIGHLTELLKKQECPPVSALIVVVDTAAGQPTCGSLAECDKTRAELHVSEWIGREARSTPTADGVPPAVERTTGQLAPLMGLLPVNIRYACVWVNKIDAIPSPDNSELREQYGREYESIRQALGRMVTKRASRHLDAEIVFGAAARGESVLKLLEATFRASGVLQ